MTHHQHWKLRSLVKRESSGADVLNQQQQQQQQQLCDGG